MNLRNHAARVLFVEDDEDDILVIGTALRESPAVGDLTIARDGDEALHAIRGEAPFEGAPIPDLVLLDLNLPGKSGHEVLDEIRKDPHSADLPVMVLTTSAAGKDIATAFELAVNAYMTKPNTADDLDELVDAVERFWKWLIDLDAPAASNPSGSDPTQPQTPEA